MDRNAEALEEKDIRWADLIMTGGMLPQRLDALAIMDRCSRLGKTVCVGGPDATSRPQAYESADFRILGEAEGIIDEFVSAWRRGDRKGLFEAQKFQADVTRSPLPRYDLLNFSHYLFIGVQFSRGCPFNCEFCDIIELY
ncbi:MAG TPA: B12-binding domain-containing radical SAM protein, partial [Methylocystis sp.]